MSEWEHVHQDFEKNWWGTCQNTYGEETKQLEYAPKMGLNLQHDSQGPYVDMQGKTVLDMGGGPVSFLLKCRNLGKGVVVDPCEYPKWTLERYKEVKIDFHLAKGEDYMDGKVYDEVWCYNVLQHTEDPAKIVSNMQKMAKIIRVFDWLEISGIGHPQYLTEENMNMWYKGQGKVEMSNGGKQYYGVFLGDHYEKP